jgi:hypothetical protein
MVKRMLAAPSAVVPNASHWRCGRCDSHIPLRRVDAVVTNDLTQGAEWVYESRLDGYRAPAIKTNGKMTLRSRNLFIPFVFKIAISKGLGLNPNLPLIFEGALNVEAATKAASRAQMASFFRTTPAQP